jgi:hypothetical protein
MNSVQLGPHQHGLILAGRHDKHRVDAIVRLFGGISYFVVFSNNYGGIDFMHSIVCDAQRRELVGMLHTVVEAELLQTEDVATSNETVWDNPVASGEWFLKFLDSRIKFYLEQKRLERNNNSANEWRSELECYYVKQKLLSCIAAVLLLLVGCDQFMAGRKQSKVTVKENRVPVHRFVLTKYDGGVAFDTQTGQICRTWEWSAMGKASKPDPETGGVPQRTFGEFAPTCISLYEKYPSGTNPQSESIPDEPNN